MMEGAKMRGAKPRAALAASKVQAGAGEYFPHEHELDDLLMKKAADVQAQMKSMETMTDPTKPKASLGQAKVQMKESQGQRAARYFATHGMMKVGHMLGDEVSASAKANLLKEHEALEEKITEKVEVSGSSNLDLPDDDDDDSAAYRKQWA